eukprot:PhF_6_TR32188/c0_g1_i2/m.47804/K01259/pip; proline iminopeptidase
MSSPVNIDIHLKTTCRGTWEHDYQDHYIPLDGNGSTKHIMYSECIGNRRGIPIVYVHGGPGSKSMRGFFTRYTPSYQDFFAIRFDQRGCGRSTPVCDAASLGTVDWQRDVNIDTLVNDMETLREYYGIEKWIVVGFSWGTTLALAYAQSKRGREHVHGLALLGTYLGDERGHHRMYGLGGKERFCEPWSTLAAHAGGETEYL